MYMSIINQDEQQLLMHNEIINEEKIHCIIQESCHYLSRIEGHILYRRDKNNLCVYSDVLLDANVLKKYGYEMQKVIKIDELYKNIKNGDCLKIYLKTVPSIKRYRPERPEMSRRCGINNREDRINWIRRKISAIGVDVVYDDNNVPFIIEDGRDRIKFSHSKNQKNSGEAQYQTYDYIITVKVNDAEQFLNGIKNGVGPYKSYGCGLLLIGAA